MQCFNNLSEEERARPLPERFGLTMRHAGVAITITSVTDLGRNSLDILSLGLQDWAKFWDYFSISLDRYQTQNLTLGQVLGEFLGWKNSY